MKRFALTIAPTIALAVALTATTGCQTKFPYMASYDRHNFVSTPHHPVSVELLDTVTDEIVWRLDVPVYKKAVVDLEHTSDWNETQQGSLPAYRVSWKVMNIGDNVNVLDQKQNLAGNPVLLRYVIRDAPELPEDPSLVRPTGEQFDPRPL